MGARGGTSLRMTGKGRARQREVGRGVRVVLVVGGRGGWAVAGLGSLPLLQMKAADVSVVAGGGRSSAVES